MSQEAPRFQVRHATCVGSLLSCKYSSFLNDVVFEVVLLLFMSMPLT